MASPKIDTHDDLTKTLSWTLEISRAPGPSLAFQKKARDDFPGLSFVAL
jgi:hypothetical protein